MPQTELAANYRYWQEHGLEWLGEYDRRKKLQIGYHLQELMLADYMRHSGPALVLEYGCGTGRHLKYLRNVPGLEVFGYDQSPTMLSGLRQWADPAWLREHVVLGSPRARLPYPDRCYDIVFTAEVLVHVRPEDVAVVLNELIRVARWQILHWEPAPGYPLVAEAHDGCWYHDLEDAYRLLGYSCQLLAQGYRSQACYRVILDETRPAYDGIAILAPLLRRMEDDVQGSLDALQKELEQIDTARKTLAEDVQDKQNRIAGLEAELAELRSAVESEETRNAQLVARCGTLQEDLTRLEKVVAGLEAKCEELLATLRERDNQIATLTSALNEVTTSRSYRLARWLDRGPLKFIRTGHWG